MYLLRSEIIHVISCRTSAQSKMVIYLPCRELVVGTASSDALDFTSCYLLIKITVWHTLSRFNCLKILIARRTRCPHFSARLMILTWLWSLCPVFQMLNVSFSYPAFPMHIVKALRSFQKAALDKYSSQCPHNSLLFFRKREDIFAA